MGKLKSELHNVIYGKKIKTAMLPEEVLTYQDSIFYYISSDSGNLGYRAVLGITNQRMIIEPTIMTEKHSSVNLFYRDIASVEEGKHIGVKLGKKPIVINVTLGDGVVYSIYASSTYNSDTKNLSGIITLAYQQGKE